MTLGQGQIINHWEEQTTAETHITNNHESCLSSYYAPVSQYEHSGCKPRPGRVFGLRFQIRFPEVFTTEKPTIRYIARHNTDSSSLLELMTLALLYPGYFDSISSCHMVVMSNVVTTKYTVVLVETYRLKYRLPLLEPTKQTSWTCI